ncbi:uncharacterized protein [Miscanthus floridulus]|uniref:uncharacterized protein n=1 Tax=Miscanthus floridulus TaxID=154761 RepID=UPI00345B35E4
MVSVILRAAARAASSAAWTSSRYAAVAAAAAASDPLMRASSVAAAVTARSPASSGSFLPIAARHPWSRLSQGSGSSPHCHHASSNQVLGFPDWAIFEADDKDLESDEALWALYERWCKFFNQERDRDEMARRFTSFKETVLCVEENKRSDLPYRLGIDQIGGDVTMDPGFLDPSRKTLATDIEIRRDCWFLN